MAGWNEDPLRSRQTGSQDLSEESSAMRWDPYVLAQGAEFDVFWTDHLRRGQRRVLMVIGRGFDPRALSAAKKIVSAGTEIDVWLLAFDNGYEDSLQRRELTQRNLQELNGLAGVASVLELEIKIGGAAQGNATSVNTRRSLKNAGPLSPYTDVVVDISAMPRMVALTAVAQILFELDALAARESIQVNLHVTTAESVSADIGSAKGTLRDDVTNVVGFSGERGGETTAQNPRVWFPILGEDQSIRLNRIKESLNPDEICPVVPFPSREPRRGDQIIKEHRQILFEDFQIEPGNILLASEYNPFEAYKQVFSAMDRYRVALGELGGCKAFVSPLSSKLLSVGALLACYDHKYGKIGGKPMAVGILYVETADYSDPAVGEDDRIELSSMWIRGEWEL